MQYKPKALLRSNLRLVACQHHPDVSFGWGYATISLRTKKIKGCTRTILSWRARLIGSSIDWMPLPVVSEVGDS